MNVLTFDIETVPDIESGRRSLGLDDLDDADVGKVMLQRQRLASGSEFLRHHLHRIVAIAVALRSGERFSVWSLGEEDASEAELLRRFFDGIERYTPTLVSWNGSGFDLPVIHYRALLHGVAAPRYWDTGDDDNRFRYNNYLGRFHQRHTDLMDVLAGYQPRAFAPLTEIASMLGLPGKLGMDGAQVYGTWLAGDLGRIRNYCETDVLNTYLVYLRFELLRGRLSPEGLDLECARVREALAGAGRAHLDEFLAAWS